MKIPKLTKIALKNCYVLSWSELVLQKLARLFQLAPVPWKFMVFPYILGFISATCTLHVCGSLCCRKLYCTVVSSGEL